MSLEYIPPKPTKAMLDRANRLLMDPKTSIPHTFYAITRTEFAARLRQAAQQQGKTIKTLSAQTHASEKDVMQALSNGEGSPALLLSLASALGERTTVIPTIP